MSTRKEEEMLQVSIIHVGHLLRTLVVLVRRRAISNNAFNLRKFKHEVSVESKFWTVPFQLTFISMS